VFPPRSSKLRQLFLVSRKPPSGRVSHFLVPSRVAPLFPIFASHSLSAELIHLALLSPHKPILSLSRTRSPPFHLLGTLPPFLPPLSLENGEIASSASLPNCSVNRAISETSPPFSNDDWVPLLSSGNFSPSSPKTFLSGAFVLSSEQVFPFAAPHDATSSDLPPPRIGWVQGERNYFIDIPFVLCSLSLLASKKPLPPRTPLSLLFSLSSSPKGCHLFAPRILAKHSLPCVSLTSPLAPPLAASLSYK